MFNNVNFTGSGAVNASYNGAALPSTWNRNCVEIEKLVEEGGKTFYRYLSWQGLTTDPNILVLSSKHHYYYDQNELKCTTTLVILKKLNLIKHVDSFLQVLHFVLSPGANFIGYFLDSATQDRKGIISMLNKGFKNILDPKTNRKIDREGVSRLLESNGFQVNDMTLINGLTYFKTQNI